MAHSIVLHAFANPAHFLKIARPLTPLLFWAGLVVAEGRFNPDGSSAATSLLAKHGEKYMPPALKDETHHTKTLEP